MSTTIPPIRKIKGYGWTPDLPDQRDHIYGIVKPIPLPAKVDLRSQFPFEAYDQQDLGSCTANAIAAAIQFAMVKQKQVSAATPSRLFIYYNERVIEKTVNEDAGAMIRDGIKSVVAQGSPPEVEWPYYVPRFRDRPSDKCYDDAMLHQTLLYQRIVGWSLKQMKTCLASGFPFVFGFAVYESFESQEVANTGIVPMPLNGESLLGGHAVLAVGYDDSTSRFVVRNSWGPNWGDNGYFTMPYAYLTSSELCDDFWTIRLVE